MKRTLFLLVALATISSCNPSQKITTFVNDHCKQVSTFDSPNGPAIITFECDSLYDAGEAAKICPKSEICFDVSKGTIRGEVKCGDKNTSLVDIFLGWYRKVSFKK